MLLESPISSFLSLFACLLGLVLIATGLCLAFSFLSLHKQIRLKRRGILRARLPSLAWLNQHMMTLIAVGVIVFGVSITSVEIRPLFQTSLVSLPIYGMLLCISALTSMSQESRARVFFWPGTTVLILGVLDLCRPFVDSCAF